MRDYGFFIFETEPTVKEEENDYPVHTEQSI